MDGGQRRASMGPRATAARLAASGPVVLALLMVGCGLASLLLGADRSWDAQNYHVYGPWRLLVPRPHDLFASGTQGFHNPAADLPLGLLLRFANDWPRVVAFVMGLPSGAVLWILWRCARHVLANAPASEALAAVATLGGAGGAVFRSQVGTSAGDVATGGLVLLAVLLLLREPARPGRAALLAGLACGSAIGLKLTNLPFAPGLAAMILLRWWGDRRLGAALALCALGGLAGIAVTYGWWGLRLALETGNPLFPYFNQVFDPTEGAPRTGRDLQFMPAGLLDALVRPFLWAVSDLPRVTEERMRDPRIALGLLSAAALMLLPASLGATVMRGRSVAAFFFVAYAIWVPVFSIYRYVAVLELLAPVLLVAALAALGPRLAMGVAAAAMIAAFPLTKPVPSLRAPLAGRYLAVDWPAMAPGATVLGTEKPTAFLAVGLPPETGLWSLLGLAETGGPRERGALVALLGSDAPLYGVAPGDGQAMTMVADRGLSVDREGCRRVCTNWSPAGAGALVCPLARQGTPAPTLRHQGPARRLCEAAGPGFVSAGRQGLRVAGEALLDFGAGCRLGEVRLSSDLAGAVPAPQPVGDGRVRFALSEDGLVRLRGDAVVGAAACVATEASR